MSNAPSNKPKITITSADLNDDRIDALANHLQKAKDIPLIREVGEAKKSNDAWLTILALVVGGVVAGLITFGLWQIIPQSTDTTSANLEASFTIAVAIAIVLTIADAAMSRSLPKVGNALLLSVPTAIVGALVLGYLANLLYTSLVETLYSQLQAAGQLTAENFMAKNHLNRGLAWSLLGAAAGVSVGVPSKSMRRVLITGLGGLIGGFLGGFSFDFFTGEQAAQSVGLAITGAIIGLSVSGLEQVSKSSWIEITRGGMAGKQFILYQNAVTLGSSPAANITLIKDPAIPGFAATIKRFGNTVTISAADRGMPISVNGVSGFDHKLTEGSMIILGSTELRFREKSKKINDAQIVRG